MLTLLHHPFCPHSRFIRLALGEYGLNATLNEERAWERRTAFLELNPAGQTPVLLVEGQPPIPGATIIAEYLDEALGGQRGGHPLMGHDLHERVEVRRLMSWFNDKFFAEVSGPLVHERLFKRYMRVEDGGGSPDSNILRAARTNIRYHVAYINWLAAKRDWLAGDRLTYADLATAAHLSVCDYLGDVPWNENENAKHWYARMKSRPSFRPLLADLSPGVPASPTYANLDF